MNPDDDEKKRLAEGAPASDTLRFKSIAEARKAIEAALVRFRKRFPVGKAE